MTWTRRDLLRGAAATASIAALSRTTPASGAGGLVGRRVPGATRDFKVLEVFFAGALSHRETLWVEVPDEAPRVREFAAIPAPPGAPASYTAWLPASGTSHTSSSYRLRAASGALEQVNLGPCAMPLVTAPSGGSAPVERLRVVATGHDLPVHEPAQALQQQGSPARTGGTRVSAVAAPIARHSGKPSFVFYHSGFPDSQNSALEAAKYGRHGEDYAPALIPFNDPNLTSLLAAPRSGARDALAEYYAEEYRGWLTFAHSIAPGTQARSLSFARYRDSLHQAFDGPALAGSLSALSASSSETVWENGARRAIRASIALLAADQAGYCCVVDAGVAGTDSFSRYDSHSSASFQQHAADTTLNVLSVLRTLREEIDAGNLVLDDTLVVLNTEFGRTFSTTFAGSEHHPYGFAVAFLGGPVPAGAKGVVGDLPFVTSDDGQTREAGVHARATGGLGAGAISATDLRSVVLQAAGIHPVQSDCYELRELNVPSSSSADTAADNLCAHLFGV